jgi:hypothetical protein
MLQQEIKEGEFLIDIREPSPKLDKAIVENCFTRETYPSVKDHDEMISVI